MASIWDDMKTSEPGGGGNYFPPGFKGKVKIKRCKFNKGFQQDAAFIVDFEVVTSNLENVKPGTERSWYQGKLEDKRLRKTALGEVAAFVGAALEVDATDEDVRADIQGQMDQIVGDENPLRDIVVLCETWNKITKENKKDFTKHKFTSVEA